MSSEGYSALLKQNCYRGKLNLRNAPDPAGAVLGKVRLLARMIRDSSHVVVHSGAGLSTAAGIADFRGPNGVWTLERIAAKSGLNPSSELHSSALPGTKNGDQSTSSTGELKRRNSQFVTFETATPTLSHMVITAMYRAGYIKYVVSQNVDGLHLRSGLARDALSELHGNLFMEVCDSCGKEYFREHEIKSVGFRFTGRTCSTCGVGRLTDKALDWDDALPEPDFQRAILHSKIADLAIIVGSSCQMNPTRNLPFRSERSGRTVIVNLSKTEKDYQCSMRIGATCDLVFALLAQQLEIEVSRFERYMELELSSNCSDSKEEQVATIGICRSLPVLQVGCTLQSVANASKYDDIPLIVGVEFEITNVEAAEPSEVRTESMAYGKSIFVRSAPYDASFSCSDFGIKRGPSSLSMPSQILATVHFLSSEYESLAVLQCSVGGPATTQKVTAFSKSYDAYVATLIGEVCRDACEELCCKGDTDVWFSRGAKRRSYLICVGCDEEIYAGKKSSHARHCKRNVVFDCREKSVE